MNSLGYLSRQLDLLAVPKQPTKDDDEDSEERRVQRVPTWSTFPPFRHLSSPKRSNSSPAFLSSNPSVNSHSDEHIIYSISPPSVSPPSPRSRPHLASVFNRIFFIRVFLLLWSKLSQAWSYLLARISILRPPTTISVSLSDDSIPSNQSPTSLDPGALPFIPTQSPRFTTDPSASLQLDSDPITLTSKLSHHLIPTLSSGHSTPIHPIDISVSSSRASTPTLPARKSAFHKPKTLVLDLDETLIHSTSRPMSTYSSGGLFGLISFGRRNASAGHMVEVVLQGKSTLYHVYKRPFVDFFLRTVSSWYTLVIFTASMQEYADPVIDWLDAGRGILVQRFFRDSCTQLPNGSYTKDLSVVESDLSRVCLVDNSPISYRVNEANGIPIEGWTHDPSDEALLDLLPVLDSLRFTSDVRRVLGLRTAGLHKTASS